MRAVLVFSGPVGSGKSTVAEAVLAAANAIRISTRQAIIRRTGVESRREPLQDAGDELDRTTDFGWVTEEVAKVADEGTHAEVIIVDAVRRREQIDRLRDRFGDRVRHVHVIASPEELERRHSFRQHDVAEPQTYAEVRASATEQQVKSLAEVADVILDVTRLDPASVAAAALAGTALGPRSRRDQLVDVLVGGQYGSEGKGNICSKIAPEYRVLMRVGGPNAGHIVYDPYYKFAQLPSGSIHNREARLVLGAGTTISIETLMREISELGVTPERLSIDPQAIVIEEEDRAWEEGVLGVIGSTKQGVGSATARKILGRGGGGSFGPPVRLARDAEELAPFVRPAFVELERAFGAGERVLLEGTQGTDISLHHGMWPHVTSRETTASGCLADAGIAPGRVGQVMMVVRTYPIRVGGTSGYMGVEIDSQVIADRSGLPVEEIRRTETGTISGNARRIAEFDLGQVRRSAALNGATMIALTFGDYLGAANREAKSFDDLNKRAHTFVRQVEDVTGVPVGLISVGPGTKHIIDRRTV